MKPEAYCGECKGIRPVEAKVWVSRRERKSKPRKGEIEFKSLKNGREAWTRRRDFRPELSQGKTGRAGRAGWAGWVKREISKIEGDEFEGGWLSCAKCGTPMGLDNDMGMILLLGNNPRPLNDQTPQMMEDALLELMKRSGTLKARHQIQKVQKVQNAKNAKNAPRKEGS